MKLLLALANLLIPVAVLVFATGFFPYKPFMPGLASHKDFPQHGAVPAKQFDKLVFMVVDALRSDFVFSSASGFSFTQKLIRTGEAIPFTAHATPPTITMPRVKAITTGSIPSFLDVILNFAESDTTSTLANQDTWLAQIRAGSTGTGKGRLVMYGDDTWLKLFPNMFTRSDGTSSFFVSDFTEVDQNVTRHIPAEIKNKDWDAMIMHYLGLDHIGHKAGPYSPYMVPKHMEMDAIVGEIYNAMLTQPHLKDTLFVLLGDHGMSDGGNHGGSAPGETSPALVFMSPKLRPLSSGRKCPVTPTRDFTFYKRIQQSDIAPTISSLLGLPIPRNNLGVIIPEFLSLWKNSQDQMNLVHRNAEQILAVAEATFPNIDFEDLDDLKECLGSSDAELLACKWKKSYQLFNVYKVKKKHHSTALGVLHNWCKDAQDVMSSAASNYNISRLLAGIALSIASLALTALFMYHNVSLVNSDTIVFGLITIVYGVMMFASSYVEEEQRFWYWVCGAWVAYLQSRSIQAKINSDKRSNLISYASVFGLLTLHRITQRWNQTGQKFVGWPDIRTRYLYNHPTHLWALFGSTYLVVALHIARSLGKSTRFGSLFGLLAGLSLAIPSALLKLGFTANDAPELFFWLTGDTVETMQQLPLVPIARAVFTLLAAYSSILVFQNLRAPANKAARSAIFETVHALISLLTLTQSRSHNIPLFLFFTLQHCFLNRLDLTPVQITASSLIFAHSSFFALGNSNAISSIDLSNGYNGVSGYNVIAVGILVFVSNWAGPIWWAVSGLSLLSRQRNTSETVTTPQQKKPAQSSTKESPLDPYISHITITTFFTAASLLAVMLACTVLRTHLFIWTVFSPKYLYSMAWSLGYHLFITLGLGGGLWASTKVS